jgi:hypothetical protein
MPILSQQKQSQAPDFPNVRPSLDLRFALAKKLDPRITFTRGSTGTYFGPDGLMRTAGVNEPRFDHDPITGQSLGLLIEEGRTNLFTRSDIEGSVGSLPTTMGLAGVTSGQSAVVSTDVSLGPNGQSCKHTRSVSSDNNIGYFGISSATAGSTYVFSAYVYIPSSQAKNFEGKTLGFIMEQPNTSRTTAFADVTILDRWQRVTGTCVPTTTAITWVLRTTANAGAVCYTDCWQLELGSFPTSYMPASGGSQFTRNPDFAQMTGTNFSSWYNSSEGTIVISTDKLYSGNFDSYRHYYQIGDVTANNASFTVYSNINGTNITNYGTTNAGRQVFDYKEINVGSAPTQFKVGQSINSKYSFFTSSKGTTTPQLPSKSAPNSQNNTTPTSVDRMWIGRKVSGGEINSHIARLTYYPIQLTNQQLINLTS